MLGAAALLLVTAGCASQTNASDSGHATKDATEPVAAELVTVPTQIFGGDCQQLLDGITGSVDFGNTEPAPAERNVAVGTLGGISCTFDGDHYLYIEALPLDQVTNELVERYQATVCEPELDGEVCRVAAESAGSWALITLGYEPSALLTEVAAAVAGALEQSPQPVQVDPASDWWAPAACAQIGERLDLPSLLGEGPIHEGYPGHGSKSVLDATLQNAGVQIGSCAWMTEQSASIRFTAYPGGAWAAAEQSAEASFVDGKQVAEAPAPLNITDGIEAISMLDNTNTMFIWLNDGVNLVFIEMRGITASPEDASGAILEALSIE